MAQSSKTGGGNAPAVAPSQATVPQCGLPCAKSLSYSVGTVTFGGGPVGESSSLTDTITDISDASITVGSLTCSYRSSVATTIAGIARVGDTVTLTCTGGVFTSMKSVGSVSR